MSDNGDTPRGRRSDPAEAVPESTGRAVIVVPVLTRHPRGEDASDSARPRLARSPQARHDEAVGLALAIDLEPVHTEIVTVADPKPGTLIGSGKIEALAEIIAERKAELVVVDHPLTPVQQRNLEKELKAKVLDRTGIILEIFGRRARTKEGALQVELAHLNYQKGRLVRSWTHLERQRGGAGFLGGPGETQIESDRRLLQEKILRLKRELETVRRTRELHRAKRKKVPYPIVAIVGYTNAGKSTLFNTLTGADAYAADQLFATLDPTVRRVDLSGGSIVLADTVGFVRDLPHELVAAFRSTLSEAREADLLLHIIDAADPLRNERIAQVDAVLGEIGAGDLPQLLVFNKIDRIEGATPRYDQDPNALADDAVRESVWISARDGLGLDLLSQALARRLGIRRVTGEVRLPPESGRLHARLHALEGVREETVDESGWLLQVDLAHADAARLASQPDGEPLRALLPPDEDDTI